LRSLEAVAVPVKARLTGCGIVSDRPDAAMGQVNGLDGSVVVEDHAVRIDLPRRASLAKFEVDENEIVRAGELEDISMAGADDLRVRIGVGDDVVRWRSLKRPERTGLAHHVGVLVVLAPEIV
jgi:hypothetical protein